MIKDALSVLPTRPVLYIAPLIVVAVMTLYYWDRYHKCSSIEQYRSALNELLSSLPAGAQFRLADSTDFAWDGVRIVENFEPERQSIDCPFDWNWPSGERSKLVAEGFLTALIFVEQGAIVRYFELRNDEVAFAGAEHGLTPETAVFSVSPDPEKIDAVALTLKH